MPETMQDNTAALKSTCVRQGVQIGRKSDLCISAHLEFARVTDVRVAGSTVLVANGRLFLS
jgi:predicted PhzF superfamily epimerase YddE/YHI9